MSALKKLCCISILANGLQEIENNFSHFLTTIHCYFEKIAKMLTFIYGQGTHVKGFHFGCFDVRFESSHRQNFSTTVCRVDRDRFLFHKVRTSSNAYQLHLVLCQCSTFLVKLLAFRTKNQSGLPRR